MKLVRIIEIQFINLLYLEYIQGQTVYSLNFLFSFIIAENVTVLDFVGVWTYNLTVNVGHSSGEQKDLEIHLECNKSSEKPFVSELNHRGKSNGFVF